MSFSLIRYSSGSIISSQPAAKTIQPWMEDAFVDIGLVQLIANFPFDRGWKHDFVA